MADGCSKTKPTWHCLLVLFNVSGSFALNAATVIINRETDADNVVTSLFDCHSDNIQIDWHEKFKLYLLNIKSTEFTGGSGSEPSSEPEVSNEDFSV